MGMSLSIALSWSCCAEVVVVVVVVIVVTSHTLHRLTVFWIRLVFVSGSEVTMEVNEVL